MALYYWQFQTTVNKRYPKQDMTHTDTKEGGSGRGAVWAMMALALAALAYLTLGLAIPNNPLYSDHATHGTSKYQFLEACHKGIADTAEMNQIKEQLVAQNRVSATDELHAEFTMPSKQVVDNILVSKEPGQSWFTATPVLVRSGLTHEPLGQVLAQCHYDKEANQTVVSLSPTGPAGL